MLSCDQLAQLLGVTSTTVRQWTHDGTLPATTYVMAGAGRRSGYEYSPRALMVGELIVELGTIFGSDNSPLPKRIARQLVQELDRIEWKDSAARLTVKFSNGFELLSDLKFLRTAKQKLSALAA